MTAPSYAPCSDCGTVNRFTEHAGDKRPICGKCGRPPPFHDGVVDVGDRGLENLLAKSPLPVVVDFWAEWCGPCRFFAPIFAAVARERFGGAVFAKVDTDAGQAAGKYGISAIPTLVVFDKGRELHRQAGALSEPAFRKLLSEVLGS